ncbi:MAG: YceI family protein [Actinobacteria bacterium]|nr:YceI family protein [Actinomycetota bacterium]
MTMRAGQYPLSAQHGRITLRTSRDGLAGKAGHDLTIDVARWSGQLLVSADLLPSSLDVQIDLGSLDVRAGTGGLKPLTDRDKVEIVATARKVLSVDRYPEATFAASSFNSTGDGGGTISGTFTIAGQSGPLVLEVRENGPDRFLARATVRQTSFGIKPYSGFLGALRVSDAVEVEVEVDLAAVTR